MSSWVRSEQSLPRHPKTLKLCRLTNLEVDTVIGRIHLLWYWALDFAFDGDLRKFDPKTIELACHLPLKQLQSAGFIDVRPFRRIHDWWDYAGNYLKLKYKNTPEKWMQIEKLYSEKYTTPNNTPKGIRKSTPKSVDVPHGRSFLTNERTDVETSSRASLEAPLAQTPGNVPLKSFDEAKDDEPCAPPKDMLAMIKKGKP